MRSLLAKCWGLFAVLTITAAVLLTFIRVLLPYISVYQDEVVEWMQRAVGQPVQVETVTAEWRGIQPRFIFSGIRFLDKHSNETRFSLDEVSVTIDVVSSALSGELRFGGLEVSGVELSVLHRKDGRIQIEEFATAPPSPAAAGDRRFLLAWLFKQSRLVLKDSEIVWHDEQYSGRRLKFVHVNLRLRNDSDRHQFDGSAALPTDLGRRFNFALDITGDVLTAGGWSGQAYVDGSGLQVNQLLKGLPLAGVRIDKGLAEVKLWSQWRESRLQRIDGEIALFSLLLNRIAGEGDAAEEGQPVPPEFLDTVSGRFSWQSLPTGWQLGVNNFVLGRWGEFWPQSDYFLRSHQDDSGRQAIEVMAEFLRLEDITALLLMTDSLDKDWRKKLAGIYPSGQLHHSHLTWQFTDTPRFDWSTRFEDLSVQSWQRLPALSGVDGRFHANQRHGIIEFNTRSARADLRPLFRAPLTINEIAGDVVWQYDAQQGWQIETKDLRLANQDLAMRTRLFANVPKTGPVYLDLVSGFSGTPDSVANTSRYLPVAKMPPRAVAWLDRAIVNGTVSGGGFVLRGPLQHFPFDDHSGRFEVRFSVQDGILDYLDNWPRIDEIEAEVIFSGRGLAVNAVSGRTMDAEILSTQVEIPNLKAHPGRLSITGKARSQTQQALQYLAATPLQKKFAGYLDGITAGGWSQLDLNLAMPLPAHEVKVKGGLRLTDSRLTIADGAVDLQQINGLLTFTNEGLSARAINGRVMGLDARFDIDTTTVQDKHVTVITGRGNATAADLANLVKLDLLQKATGRTEWQAELTLPAADGPRRVADLHVSSSLKGITTHLPAPLAKQADAVRNFELDMRFPRSVSSPVTFAVDGVMSGMLDIDRAMQFRRGELRFPAGPLSLPDQPGLRLAGLVPSFSFSDWWPLIKAARDQTATSNQPGINQLDLQLGELELFGQHFSDLKVAAQYQSPYWRAEVDGAQAAGNILLPVDDNSPLLMDMQRLQLETATGDEQGELTDPRNLPPLNIKSQQFSMAGIDFGSLDLVASRHVAGLTVSELKLRSKVMEILARGDWVVADEQHYSSFNITFNSADLGKALSRFGYVNTVSKGDSTFDIVARWPGSPVAFALARLDGNMHMRIENGRLLEIDPGAGRIFGLLSLSALPRRLVLDFRDIFQKGFSFDRIKGDFVIKNGVATTNNLQLKGPAARLEAAGRIGLASQDYDQIINVFPDVAAGLPVAGAVASGLGVGAAILLVKELLKPEIEQASQVRYAVKGPWSKPVITRLEIEERGDKNKKKGK